MRRRGEAADRRQHRQAAGAAAAEGRSPVKGPVPGQKWPLVRVWRLLAPLVLARGYFATYARNTNSFNACRLCASSR